jgi:hypothetical protein
MEWNLDGVLNVKSTPHSGGAVREGDFPRIPQLMNKRGHQMLTCPISKWKILAMTLESDSNASRGSRGSRGFIACYHLSRTKVTFPSR